MMYTLSMIYTLSMMYTLSIMYTLSMVLSNYVSNNWPRLFANFYKKRLNQFNPPPFTLNEQVIFFLSLEELLTRFLTILSGKPSI